MKRWSTALGLILFFATYGVAGKNAADYPLQVQIIESHWHNHRDGTVNGWGQGNVLDGDSIHGFDFEYQANEPFHRTRGNAHFIARWKKASLKMEMLVGQVGSVDKFNSYELRTSMREEVYVPGPNGAEPISQEEYRAGQQQPPAQQQSTDQEQPH